MNLWCCSCNNVLSERKTLSTMSGNLGGPSSSAAAAAAAAALTTAGSAAATAPDIAAATAPDIEDAAPDIAAAAAPDTAAANAVATLSRPRRISRVYAQVNAKRRPSFFGFLISPIPVDTFGPSVYAIIHQIDSGAFSEVFKAVRRSDPTGQQLALKRLRDSAEMDIKREIRILRELKGACNTIKLLAVHQDPMLAHLYLVFELIENVGLRDRIRFFGGLDIRTYMLQLLEALDFCHSRGIMHRDVKPENILIDSRRKRLLLADFGAATFYMPGDSYDVGIGTFYYMSPEVLMRYHRYDYSVDMWAFGCCLAGMLFRRSPFFSGEVTEEVLANMAAIIGGRQFHEFADAVGVQAPQADDLPMTEHGSGWSVFVNSNNAALNSPVAHDLLEKVMVVDPYVRLTAAEAMAHAFFDPVRRPGTVGTVAKSF